MNVEGKRAIVTGGLSGLGLAIVSMLVEKGARVTVIDINGSGFPVFQDDFPEVDCLECDISSYDQVEKTMATYHVKNRSADILINNAGILYSAPLARITMKGIERHDPRMWEKTLASNLGSVFNMSSFVVERMIVTRTKGVIVNVSSVSAAGNAGQSAYSAAKAGVNALTATWAKELGALGIRVAAVAPGFTDTPSTNKALSKDLLDETVRRVPLRRLGRSTEIAQAVLSLIENDFFNGKVLEIDGGLVL